MSLRDIKFTPDDAGSLSYRPDALKRYPVPQGLVRPLRRFYSNLARNASASRR